MSTKITQIYTALVDLMGSTFPDFNRLQNVEDLEANPAPQLRAGWAIEIGAGRNTDRQTCPTYSLSRLFTLTLTRECLAKDSDAERREAAKVGILEDLHLLLAATFNDPQLSGACISCLYQADSAPAFFQNGDKTYLAVEGRFTVEYIQQIGG